MTEFPRTLKHITLWLLLGTAVFLGVQSWQAQQRQSRCRRQLRMRLNSREVESIAKIRSR